MCASLRWIAGVGLALASLNVCSFAAVTEEPPNQAPPWLSQVAELKAGASQSFQFRAYLRMPGFPIVAYVAWSPPNSRSVIFCDGDDGLPLLILVDGDAWTYDLVGGQIVHLKAEPQFTMQVKGEDAKIGFGTVAASKHPVIDLDLVSFLNDAVTAKADATGRFAMAKSPHGADVLLQVAPKGPPLPVRFSVFFSQLTPPGALGCDDFHFNERMPRWHHPLDAETLAKDVPFLDATNMKNVGQSKQEQLRMTTKLLFGQVTFLLRPALRTPELRQKLEQSYPKLDFKQMELHEKLLKAAWLRTLDKQDSNPAKFAPPLPAAKK